MGAGIMAEKTPIKITMRRNEELKLKENARMDNAIAPIPMSHC